MRATNLSHRHFQTGGHQFCIFDATSRSTWLFRGVTIHWLRYPCVALRMEGKSREEIYELCCSLLSGWRNGNFGDLQNDLQTMSLIAHYIPREAKFEVILIPRNAEKPRFLTRPSLHCIKKEFVGIFEMCGFAILPGRLSNQIRELAKTLESYKARKDLGVELQCFGDWVENYFLEWRAKGLVVPEAIEMGIKMAFLDILSDNSPFKSHDHSKIALWLKESGIM